MATTFLRIETHRQNDEGSGDISLTSFDGGDVYGRSLQVTCNNHSMDPLQAGYISLTRNEVVELVNKLNKWLDGDYLAPVS